MSKENSIEQLKYFLKEMFQFNANDLDFGIYKIFNLKRKQIQKFIDGNDDNCLVPIIEKTLDEVKNLELQADLTLLKTYAKSLNQEDLIADPKANYKKIQHIIEFSDDPKQKEELQNTLDNSTKDFKITEELKDKIYNHILAFFEMYYSNGDFGYNDRSRSLYKVPYEADYDGSDTMFHWKHKGSLYIKTGNSFNAIKFNLDKFDKEIEYRLETNEESVDDVALNNNKDTNFKHYRLNRIEEKDGVFQVIFNLSDASTPKEEIFKKVFEEVLNNSDNLQKYLISDDKPVFNDLKDDYDKVQDGGVKGIGSLRIDRKKVLTKVNKNFGRGEKIEIDEDKNIIKDETLETLYSLDQKLNSFYVGNDSDYFIHENLQEFLTNEKDRYIKNYVLNDINNILDGKLDNTTIIIAKAFNIITSRLIEFMSAIEEFQKELFTMKKKIVECEYCLTTDNIDEKYYPEILENKEQLAEWERLFSVKVKNLNELKNEPTLVLDTKFFKKKDGSNEFKDNILSDIEALDTKTNGLLINSENYQALIILIEKYRGKINTIYIDPPYNSPSSSIIYKNSFKHSSWATLMFNRLMLSKSFLGEKGCNIIAIDENEQNNLFSLNKEIFQIHEYDNVLVSIEHNKKGIQGDHFSYSNEFALFSIPFALKKINTLQIEKEDWEWSNFRNWGGESLRTDAKNCFYPVIIDKNDEIIGFGEVCDENYHPSNSVVQDKGNFLIYPIDKEGIERKWRYSRDSVEKIKNRLKLEKDSQGVYQIKIAKVTRSFKTMWYDSKHNAGDYGTRLMTSMGLPKGSFDFPKSLYLVKDCIFVNDTPISIVFDYFAGSGTTGHAVLKLNKESKEESLRKYILVEMGMYFDAVLIERMKKAIYSDNWSKGKPINNDGSGKHIFKYLVLEQYEELLDSIEPYKEETSNNLPLKYLYKPELNSLNSTLDLSKPFANKINYGKPTKEGFVDLVETYNYFQGYEVKTLKTYNKNKKYYKVVETTDNRLVIWRDIKLKEDDSKAIIEIIKEYDGIESVDINYDFNLLSAGKDQILNVDNAQINVTIIYKEVFDQ